MIEQPTPEKNALNLGFVPLLDAAPLIVAQELGFFEEAGLSVTLHREASWASLRDKLLFGLLDGAHVLAPMVVASQVRTPGSRPLPKLTTALALGYNGNAITFSNALADTLNIALPAHPKPVGQALKAAVTQRALTGRPRLVFGTVYPFSMHSYLLRMFLSESGIEPDVDVDIRVLPPQAMVEALRTGDVDGYCVGEPWNSGASTTRTGQIAVLGYDIWQNAPEKVLGVSEAFAKEAPGSHQALMTAVIRACQWLDEPDRIASVAHWLSQPKYLDCSSDLLLCAMQTPWLDGAPRWRKHYFRYAATFPWRSHAEWMLDQMLAAGQITQLPDERRLLIERAYDTDTWRSVATRLELPIPSEDDKSENTNGDVHQALGIELGPNLHMQE